MLSAFKLHAEWRQNLWNCTRARSSWTKTVKGIYYSMSEKCNWAYQTLRHQIAWVKVTQWVSWGVIWLGLNLNGLSVACNFLWALRVVIQGLIYAYMRCRLCLPVGTSWKLPWNTRCNIGRRRPSRKIPLTHTAAVNTSSFVLLFYIKFSIRRQLGTLSF